MFTASRPASATAVALLAAVSVPALTGADSLGTLDITVRERVRSATFVHAKASTRGERLAQGDRVLTSHALFDGKGTSLGTLFTDCVNVGRPADVSRATLQCSSTYRFKDGQVVSEGVIQLGAAADMEVPIVGGSGSYREARGQITHGTPVKGFDEVDVLHLDY